MRIYIKDFCFVFSPITKENNGHNYYQFIFLKYVTWEIFPSEIDMRTLTYNELNQNKIVRGAGRGVKIIKKFKIKFKKNNTTTSGSTFTSVRHLSIIK